MFGDSTIKWNFITIGKDCSPATALKNMGLRKEALPFDWVESKVNALDKCFAENFERFHTKLYKNKIKTRMIDSYGFEFPHDYPTIQQDISGQLIPEYYIADGWESQYDVIKAKYGRRIDRFRNILSDPAPIIVLCRYYMSELRIIQTFFIKYYNKHNVYFVNATHESFENDNILCINPEKMGDWNNTKIWSEGISQIIQKIKT
jgi:hypothetical protein